MNTRTNEIKALWQRYQGLYVVAGILIGMMMFPFMELLIHNLRELLLGLVPEAIGIIFTVGFLNRMYEDREEKRYKQQLIRKMGSLDNSTALSAAEEINSRNWAQDGSLVGAYFREANLKNIRIRQANLSQTDLVGVNLTYGEMYRTNFSNAQMSDSDLCYGQFNVSTFENAVVSQTDFRYSRLRSCNFHNALLDGSDFENADLEDADLRGADLSNANLEGATLGDRSGRFGKENIDEDTILPDRRGWRKGTDLQRFTDPDHPEFWRPNSIDPTDSHYDIYEVPFWWVRQNHN